jgi:hypothetical protein
MNTLFCVIQGEALSVSENVDRNENMRQQGGIGPDKSITMPIASISQRSTQLLLKETLNSPQTLL